MKQGIYSLLLLLGATANAHSDTPIHLHYEGVLGTSMDINVSGSEQASVEKAVDIVSQRISALENILSTWKKDSAISQLNQTGKSEAPEPALFQVLSQCQHWETQSKGHFSCKLGALKTVWQQTVRQQDVPDRVAMRYMARDIQQSDYQVNKEKITLGDNIELDIAGLAKGYILDVTLAALKQQLPSARGIQVNIGGDLVMWSHPTATPWNVSVASPFAPKDNQTELRLSVSQGAIAASGHKSRGYQIDNRHFSHILAPKDGWPADNSPGAIVYAKDALTADAAATTLSTQGITSGIDWVNQQPGIEALLITENGIKLASKGWADIATPLHEQIDKGLPLLNIHYQIPTLPSEKYHRPYLSIWITDTNQRSIRNLLILGETQRWAKKNSRWWRKVGRRNSDLLDNLARPTRRPGQYELSWNGLDDFGNKVPSTEYWVHFEASREGGGHDYQKVLINLAEPLTSQALNAKGELGSARITGSESMANLHSQ